MKLFIIICMSFMVGFTVYTYKVILDIAKHIDETLVQHDIELARFHYHVDELTENNNFQENKKKIDRK